MFGNVGALILLTASGLLAGAEAPSDTVLAGQYFDEARALWQRDGGRLWGVSLQCPLMFLDPKGRRVFANQADGEGQLHAQGGVFTGALSQAVPVANSTARWAGVRWTTVVWPLPTDQAKRGVLMMHESWHRIQDAIGLPPTGPANVHLDTEPGRLWLQLEWRALAQALGLEGDARRAAGEDALAFRAYRRSLFDQAAAQENALELHEGLAEYTGVKLCGLKPSEQIHYVRQALAKRPGGMPTFVRSFAYLSGPAYGLLLDEAGASWRKGLKQGQDLGVLLGKAMGLDVPHSDEADCLRRAKKYAGDELQAAEARRERERRRRISEFRARLVDGPVLVLPLRQLQYSMDPNTLQPLGEAGTVYPALTLSDAWGVLSVTTGGALLNRDFTRAFVTAPKDPAARPLKGQGWELDLRPGWVLEPGPRAGDFHLTQRSK